MTLDELLALLPDNTTGEIDAADLRTIVTELFNKTAAVQTEADANSASIVNVEGAVGDWAATTNARIDALEAQSNTHSIAGVYRLTATPGADPNDGNLSTDTGALNTATL